MTLLVLLALSGTPALAADPDAFPVDTDPAVTTSSLPDLVRAAHDAADRLGPVASADDPKNAAPITGKGAKSTQAAPVAAVAPPPVEAPVAPAEGPETAFVAPAPLAPVAAPPAPVAAPPPARAVAVDEPVAPAPEPDVTVAPPSSAFVAPPTAEAAPREPRRVELPWTRRAAPEPEATRPLAIAEPRQPDPPERVFYAAPAEVAPPFRGPADEVRPVDTRPEWRHEQRTLFGARKRKAIGLYAGATGGTTRLDGRGVSTRGLEGGAILGSSLVLGGAGYVAGGDGLFDRPSPSLSYGGFLPGLQFGGDSLLHVRADVLLGSGLLDTDEGLFGLAVVVPRVAAELNVTRGVRVSAFGAYRVIRGPRELPGPVGGTELGLTVRLGWF